MESKFFVASKKIKFLVLAIAICVGLGLLVYFLVWGEQFEKPKQYSKEDKEELAELSRVDLIGAVYNYVFNEVLDSEVYEENPIEAFNASGVAVEDGEVMNVQQGFSVARFWDLIFASYLYGHEVEDEDVVTRAVDAREFLYSNAVPFSKGPHSKTLAQDVTYMSVNDRSVCYPLKFKERLPNDLEEFYSESCSRQYMDAERLALPCYQNGNFTVEDLETLLNLIKDSSSDEIETFTEAHNLAAEDTGDMAVDYFILGDFIEELVEANVAEWDDWDFSEIDYEAYKDEIEGTMEISIDENELATCLKTQGYNHIAASLLSIYENKKVLNSQSGEVTIGFSEEVTFPLINTLLYLEQSDHLADNEKTVISGVIDYLILEPSYYFEDHGYNHGISRISLLEMCLVEDVHHSEVFHLSVTDEDPDDDVCPYAKYTYDKLIYGGCESSECYNLMLFNDEYVGEDDTKYYHASAADTMRVVFDLILLDTKYENAD